jgi:hypothetical protein
MRISPQTASANSREGNGQERSLSWPMPGRLIVFQVIYHFSIGEFPYGVRAGISAWYGIAVASACFSDGIKWRK